MHDGDTLVLADGRRVRVIGINAPEVAREGPAEPYADQATRAAREFLAGSATVSIQIGADAKDRYGRVLAHVFRTSDGASLAAELIAKGLVWQIAVPPNLAHLECYRVAEDSARAAARALWSPRYLATEHAGQLQPGFRVLRARIVDFAQGKSWWLETDAGFVVQIAPRDQSWFDRQQVSGLPGTEVEVRGWMYNRAGSAATARGHLPWVLTLRHSSGLRPQN